MRIIAGQYRGRQIAAPKGQQTRPTADRARETLFSMLTSRLDPFPIRSAQTDRIRKGRADDDDHSYPDQIASLNGANWSGNGLGGFTGLAVADLFAGSGALGLEALSRGAATCLFVERDTKALAIIRANIAALGASGTTVRAGDATHLVGAPTPFDLIFLDPPYDSVDLGALIDRLIATGWTRPGTIFSIETGISVETRHHDAPHPHNATPLTSRKVGKAMLHLFAVG